MAEAMPDTHNITMIATHSLSLTDVLYRVGQNLKDAGMLRRSNNNEKHYEKNQ